jgi:monothiol glutaredoxin
MAASVSSLSAVSAIRGSNARVGGARRSSVAPARRRVAVKVSAEMGPEMKAAMDKFLDENKVVCFIKGTKAEPKCGFSNTVVQIFNSMVESWHFTFFFHSRYFVQLQLMCYSRL